MSRPTPTGRSRLSAVLSACAIVSALATTTVLVTPLTAVARPDTEAADGGFTAAQVQAEIRPGELAAFGHDEAEYRAWARLESRAALRETRASAPYPQPMRTARYNMLTSTQEKINNAFDAKIFGKFTDYFPSPDYGDHIAMLPTGKVLIFSFEPIETDPTKEPAPTNTIGKDNAGRAYVWDPSKGTVPAAFKAVPPPDVTLDDGTGASARRRSSVRATPSCRTGCSESSAATWAGAAARAPSCR